MFVVTREDLEPGYVVAQSVHAGIAFCKEHPDLSDEWYFRSNFLACLSARNEDELLKLIKKADQKGVRYSIFFEPDLGYSITSVTLEPGVESRRLCSSFGLALRAAKKKAA